VNRCDDIVLNALKQFEAESYVFKNYEWEIVIEGYDTEFTYYLDKIETYFRGKPALIIPSNLTELLLDGAFI